MRVVGDRVTTKPVAVADLDALAALFASERTTRHCSCMAFCSTRLQFSLGWFGGGNARRFAALVVDSPHPMGVMARDGHEAVGWAAAGPRTRYAVSAASTKLMPPGRLADGATWFVPCFFIRRGHRGRGLTHALLDAVVDLAGREGAPAVEGWPVASSVGRSPDSFVGREQVFADRGFTVVARPTPERVIMRLKVPGPRG